MKVIIAGPRDCGERALIDLAVESSKFNITEVVSGRARGVDSLGERWAGEHSVPVKPFPALWELYGRRAGGIRNLAMGLHAEALIAIDRGLPKGGTRDMINVMRKLHKPMFLLKVDDKDQVIGSEVYPVELIALAPKPSSPSICPSVSD